MGKALRIAVGADHGGFDLKREIVEHLRAQGHAVRDCGTHARESVDYPHHAYAVALLVASGACDFGVMVDGAGIGSCMAANKVRGARAAACYNEALARNSREHNDANVLTLGATQTKNIREVRPILDAFLGTACTADRHLRRVRQIEAIERSPVGPAPREVGKPMEADADMSPDDVQRIARRVQEILRQEGPSAPASPGSPLPTPEELAGLIDHTLLRPEASAADIGKLCDEAVRNRFYSVCVNPANVRQAVELVRHSAVRVCCVVGFPLGAQSPEIKMLEARRAIREGAREIDMVINIGALRSRDDGLVLRDIRGVVEACLEGHALCKVILETSLLNDEEKTRACEISMKAGAHFVKTSTGFSTGGATPEDIALMARVVAPRKLGVKASGGVRTYADAVKMIRAGATRIGSSNSVQMIEEARAAAAKKE
jgi:deoxyribose-phosphate aldolase